MDKTEIDHVINFAPEPKLIEGQSSGLVYILTSIVKILRHVCKLIDNNKLDEAYIKATKNEIFKNIQDYIDIYQYDSGIDSIVKIEIDRFFTEVKTLFPNQ